MPLRIFQRLRILWICGAFVTIGLLYCASLHAQGDDTSISTSDQTMPQTSKKSRGQPTVRLEITVKGKNDKPVADASVYVRYTIPAGVIHKEKLAELDLKTAGDGSVRVPAVPQGKIMIQVIAAGWHTYGKWYEFQDKEEDSVEIKLEPPHRWY